MQLLSPGVRSSWLTVSKFGSTVLVGARMISSRCLTFLLGALVLAGCGGAGQHYAPAPTAEPTSTSSPLDVNGSTSPRGKATPQTVSITETASSNERGLLDVLATGAMSQSLGSLEFSVRNRAGAVLSRGFNEVHGADSDRRLLLDLPAGEDYELVLESTGFGSPSTACHAQVGPLAVAPGATASYQAFLWQCDDAEAAPAPADECYWLADWIGTTRTRAAVGDSIELGVSAKDASGVGAHVAWLNQAPQLGTISDEHAAKTRFTCDAPSEAIPITVVITGDACSRRLTMTVACD